MLTNATFCRLRFRASQRGHTAVTRQSQAPCWSGSASISTLLLPYFCPTPRAGPIPTNPYQSLPPRASGSLARARVGVRRCVRAVAPEPLQPLARARVGVTLLSPQRRAVTRARARRCGMLCGTRRPRAAWGSLENLETGIILVWFRSIPWSRSNPKPRTLPVHFRFTLPSLYPASTQPLKPQIAYTLPTLCQHPRAAPACALFFVSQVGQPPPFLGVRPVRPTALFRCQPTVNHANSCPSLCLVIALQNVIAFENCYSQSDCEVK